MRFHNGFKDIVKDSLEHKTTVSEGDQLCIISLIQDCTAKFPYR